MQHSLLFLSLHIPLHASAYKAIFRWGLFELFVVTLLRAEPHVGFFVIPKKFCVQVHKIRKIHKILYLDTKLLYIAGVKWCTAVLSNVFIYKGASDWWLSRRGRPVAIAIIIQFNSLFIYMLTQQP
jgi:hypothetical protein